ncbi:hypothetical protein PN498_03830 [Oscillatoria sp. CS-180]|uniref:hypothetical protein n=1 Tax=Oscillatoria sp. CS-180 TaxID=3021720 RepID=UPI00232C6E96|nr:hypothetical protein [Oscillatoria sp. CS-180]MDB9525105.1 hypothetical protein [Oscillatoria sp. CS-180]
MSVFLQLVFAVAYRLVQAIQPFLVPICFVLAWTTLAFMLWSLWAMLRDGVQRAKLMHQIPCSRCQYFSGNYLLKCPLHPREALSEAAISCRDFESVGLERPLSES